MGERYTGTVTRGKQLGRKLGFPTANITVEAGGDQPREGVYAIIAYIDGKAYEGMGNVGRRGKLFGDGKMPACGSSEDALNVGRLTLEVNLFGFEEDLYGRTIEVELARRIRDERKFESTEELRSTLENDRRTILKYFSKKR